MKLKSLRQEILKMTRKLDLLTFSQFTIDWFEDLEIEEAKTNPEITVSDENHALKYRIEVVEEVLKEGKDKDLFKMLSLYSRLFLYNDN